MMYKFYETKLIPLSRLLKRLCAVTKMVLGKNHFPIQEMGVRIVYSPKSTKFLFEKC